MGETGGFGARGGVGDLHVWHWDQCLMGCQGEAFPHYYALVEEGSRYGRSYFGLEVKTPHPAFLSE